MKAAAVVNGGVMVVVSGMGWLGTVRSGLRWGNGGSYSKEWLEVVRVVRE